MAVPPCGVAIPARVGDLPGHMECCIFKLYAKESPNSPQFTKNYYLEAVVDPRGNPMRAEVYNIYEVEVAALLPPDEQYVRITKEKGGRWLVEYPSQEIPTSTSSSSSTTQPLPPGTMVCQAVGEGCKFTWVEETRTWTPPDQANCAPTEFSTTSSTSESSTTSDTCLCPTTSTTTSSTSSSSSTTSVCQCLWPSFCGTMDGQCTITTCSPLRNDPPECGQTTSTTTSTSTSSTTTDPLASTSSTSATTCDCPPGCDNRSTTTPAGCAGGCYWVSTPFGTTLLTNDCAAICPCGPPVVTPDPDCSDIFHSGCVMQPSVTTVACTAGCYGECHWFSPDGIHWGGSKQCKKEPGKTSMCCCPNFSSGFVPPQSCCKCSPPDRPPSGPCDEATTKCGCDPTCCDDPSSTTAPCPECCNPDPPPTSSTSSTTSSSTSTQPCDRRCKWQAQQTGPGEDLIWEAVAGTQQCPAECPCGPPLEPPTDLCQYTETVCGTGTTSTTTTTTTSTSTSTTSTTTCRWFCVVNDPAVCATVSDRFCYFHCGDQATIESLLNKTICGGPYGDADTCDKTPANPCYSTTSTSTTSPDQWYCFECFFEQAHLSGCWLDTPDEFNCQTAPPSYNSEAECNAGCAHTTTTSTTSTSTTTAALGRCCVYANPNMSLCFSHVMNQLFSCSITTEVECVSPNHNCCNGTNCNVVWTAGLACDTCPLTWPGP